MTLLIFFSVVFATIVLAIVLQRIINCPILVGFAFFSIFLVVAAVLDTVTFVLIAIGLGILAFIVAFLDCILRRSGFFRNNSCLNCDCDDYNEENVGRSGRNSRRNNCNCNCNCGNNTDETLTIINSNGRVVARISGNNITCNEEHNSCGCNNSGINLVSGNGNIALTDGNVLAATDSNCGCNGRNNRWGRY